MDFERTAIVYFSATDVTRKYVRAMGKALDKPIDEYDFTLIANRDPRTAPSFGPDCLVIVGVPIYGGRVPTVCLDYLYRLKGDGTPCIVVGSYGNRDFDDAVVELEDIMSERGFVVIGGAAVIGRHSFSDEIAGHRPTREDLDSAAEFARRAAAKDRVPLEKGIIPGNRPYKEKGNNPNTMLPSTLDTCINCKMCAKKCPNGVISIDDPKTFVKDASNCLRCNSCVVRCPVKAKYFDGEMWQKMVAGAVRRFGKPDKENRYFI